MLTLFLFTLFLIKHVTCASLAVGLECQNPVVDIICAIDASFSLDDENFQNQLIFLQSLIDFLPIGRNQVQIGVVSFSANVVENIKLNESSSRQELKIAVGRIKRRSQGTMTHKAIHHIHTTMFRADHGGRPEARHQIILITDGWSENETATLMEASVAKSKQIEIISVGVGNSLNNFELRAVASEPKDSHVFRVDNFKALLDKTLGSSACYNSVSHIIPETLSDCLYKVADVVFVLDSSSSIWEPDFRAFKNFIQNVSNNFDIGPNLTRVGVIAFSDVPLVIVDMNVIQTKADVHDKLRHVPYISGNTNSAKAINYAWTHLLEAGQNLRPYAAKILIMLTDGHSDSQVDSIREAEFLRSKGVDVFVLGIGGQVNKNELTAITNHPKEQHFFHVNKSDELESLEKIVAKKMCYVMKTSHQNKQDQCSEVATDAVFIYDRNIVFGQHHDFIINVITEVVKSSGMTNNDIRFGVIRDAPRESSASSDIELTNHWSESLFKKELDFYSKQADIDLLLQKVRIRYFQPLSRVKEKKIVVLFLDSDFSDKMKAVFEAIRLRRSHVRIVVVAIGKEVNLTQVKELVSLPQEKYIIELPFIHKVSLSLVTAQLLRILCD